MASVHEVMQGLMILAKYDPSGRDSRDIGAEHDVIYGPGGGPEVVSEEDRNRLEALGWHWDEEVGSWARFVWPADAGWPPPEPRSNAMSRTRKAGPSAKAMDILATAETPSLASLSDEEIAARLRAIEDEAGERRKPLDAEIRRRRDDSDRRALAERRERNEVVAQNARWLLDCLLRDHVGGCSDDRRSREGGCARCMLLGADEADWLDDDYRVSLVVENRPLRDPDGEAKP